MAIEKSAEEQAPVAEEQAVKAEVQAPKAEAQTPKNERKRGGRFSRKENVQEQPADSMEEIVLSINRCTKVVKGGKNMSFGALIVVGDRKGKVGFGYGKANEVSDAIRKAQDAARRNMFTVPMAGETIPHTVEAKFAGSKVLIRPASAGTGVIAGGAMRAVLDLAGIVDVLGKSLGSGNPANVVKATFKALGDLKSKQDVLTKRGLAK